MTARSSVWRVAVRARSSRLIGRRSILQAAAYHQDRTSPALSLFFGYGAADGWLKRNPSNLKAQVLAKVAHHGKEPSQHISAATVLASAQYASWLEDQAFISELVNLLFGGPRRGTSPGDQFTVVSAAVDALSPLSWGSRPRHGLSIITGASEDLLVPAVPDVPGRAKADNDETSCIDFRIPAAEGSRGEGAVVTFPLANTIFETGRLSTLLRNRWAATDQGTLQLSSTEQPLRQTVCLPRSSSANAAQLVVPLISATPPRKVLACFGNIVRTIEVDGKPVAASDELEACVNRYVGQRITAGGGSGPVKVWARIHPAHESVTSVTAPLDMHTFDMASLAAGGRLCQVLSGGGGWGPKRGLLALDPTVSHYPDTGDDLDRLIRSFEAQSGHSPGAPSDLVTPGCYLSFEFSIDAIERDSRSKAIGELSIPSTSNRILLGTCSPEDTQPQLDPKGASNGPPCEDDIEVIEDHFGAVSASGMFVTTEAASNKERPAGHQQSRTSTRINVPSSCILV